MAAKHSIIYAIWVLYMFTGKLIPLIRLRSGYLKERGGKMLQAFYIFWAVWYFAVETCRLLRYCFYFFYPTCEAICFTVHKGYQTTCGWSSLHKWLQGCAILVPAWSHLTRTNGSLASSSRTWWQAEEIIKVSEAGVLERGQIWNTQVVDPRELESLTSADGKRFVLEVVL